MKRKNGCVVLVGAGPGDSGLLTVKGKQLLQQADVVVYDRLVSRPILELIGQGAEKIDVGKERGRHPVPQEEINRILLEQAQQGKRVVRLKGGDPFVFGRGAEELELLAANDIPFEVVPGIPSAVAALAYAGIPVTHRDCCSSFHVITGHAKAGGTRSIPYQELVKLQGTLVFLMGVAALPQLVEGLLAAGMAPDMPAAIVENGTRPDQRKLVATLETLAAQARLAQIVAPAVIAVGKVCALSNAFDWFSARPLSGQRVLIVHPAPSSGTLVEQLAALGARVVDCPCFQIKQIDLVLPKLDSYSWIGFSSKNAVRFFFSGLYESGRDARALAGIRIGAVGSQTADCLKQYGVLPDLVPAVFDGAHLAEEIAAKGDLQKPVLLCGADRSAGQAQRIFAEKGIPCETLALYEMEYHPPAESIHRALAGEKIWGMFTSASGAEAAARFLTQEEKDRVTAVCIGPQTEQEARRQGFATILSPQATLTSMITTLQEECIHAAK